MVYTKLYPKELNISEKDNRVSIWHFIWGVHNGGVERVIYNYFSNMDISNYDLHLVVHIKPLESYIDKFINLGFTIHELSLVDGHRITINNLREYHSLFSTNHMDIVHNHFPNNLLPLLYARLFKVKVRILHSHIDFESAFSGKNKLTKMIYGLGLWVNKKNATSLFACGEKAGKTCFGKSSFIMIRNAIKLDKYAFDDQKRIATRERLDLPEDIIVIGNVGRFDDYQKNQEFAIKVFEKLFSESKKYCLIFIGDGKYRKEMMDRCNNMSCGDRILFLGNVHNIENYLCAMDIFFLPSVFEGFSVASIEAQCSGLPGIMSDSLSPEMNILGHFRQVSLNAGVEKWIDAFKMIEKIPRHNGVSELRIKGYDILVEATRLDRIYRELMMIKN